MTFLNCLWHMTWVSYIAKLPGWTMLDRICCALLRLGDAPLFCRSECSSRDSEWSSEHLSMPPSETPSTPILACSTPLLGELTGWSSPWETLPEASPPSHRGWTSCPPNSHCNWASQFFQRSTSLRAICQGRQSGFTTPTISHLETESTQ